MRTIYFKKIFPLLLTAALLCMMGMTAMAAQEMPDLSKTGSISVTMQDSDSKKTVSGGTLTLYKVGDVQVYNGFSFVLTDEFSGSRLDLDDVESADLAEKLADYAESAGLQGTAVTVGENGVAAFPDLELGLYLIVQTEAADGYYAVSPYLVSVPKLGENGYVYDVDATPKMAALTAVPVTTDKPDSKLPQTGQLNWPVPVLSIAGLLLFAIGWALRYSKRDEHYAA